jgi:hypothetical protein
MKPLYCRLPRGSATPSTLTSGSCRRGAASLTNCGAIRFGGNLLQRMRCFSDEMVEADVRLCVTV